MKLAFIGKMMSGKTTCATYLVRSENFTRLAFADPVKHVSAKMLNVLGMEIYGAQWSAKNHYWDYDRVNTNKGVPAVRKLLQLVGTELGRELVGYQDVWADMLIQQVNDHENVVVDDCRFPNEAEALRDAGFSLIRVERPDEDRIAMVKERYPTSYEDILRHPSETSLDDFEPDTIIRASSLASQRKQLVELMRYYHAH